MILICASLLQSWNIKSLIIKYITLLDINFMRHSVPTTITLLTLFWGDSCQLCLAMSGVLLLAAATLGLCFKRTLSWYLVFSLKKIFIYFYFDVSSDSNYSTLQLYRRSAHVGLKLSFLELTKESDSLSYLTLELCLAAGYPPASSLSCLLRQQ